MNTLTYTCTHPNMSTCMQAFPYKHHQEVEPIDLEIDEFICETLHDLCMNYATRLLKYMNCALFGKIMDLWFPVYVFNLTKLNLKFKLQPRSNFLLLFFNEGGFFKVADSVNSPDRGSCCKMTTSAKGINGGG